MINSMHSIRSLLRERGEATRPEIAKAIGLSLVSVNKLVEKLCESGEIEAAGERPSGGGRPARLYRICCDYAQIVYFRAERCGSLIMGELETYNLHGECTGKQGTEMAYLATESIDEWLDNVAERGKICSITLDIASDFSTDTLYQHLRKRYKCPLYRFNKADALADNSEGTATVYFKRGYAPQCSIRRHGCQMASKNLELLPMPHAWSTLDYSDHTLVEEMIARLIVTLACTLVPTSFTLHADFWTNRLVKRIVFNISSKMRGNAPPVNFQITSPTQAEARMRVLACRLHPPTSEADI